MNKYVIGIDGMRCSMCEAHVCEALRKTVRAKKVSASHIKNQAIVISEETLTQEEVESIFAPTGYHVTSFKAETATKGFFGWR